MEAWLQPATSTDGTEPEFPSLPSLSELRGIEPVTKNELSSSSSKLNIRTGPTKPSNVAQPTETVFVSTAKNQLSPSQIDPSFQRRRASDSSLLSLFPCQDCGRVHQNTYGTVSGGNQLLIESTMSKGSLSPVSGIAVVPRSGQTSGPVNDRLVMVLRVIAIASIVSIFALYKLDLSERH